MATLTRNHVTVDASGVLVTVGGYRDAGTITVLVRTEWEQVVADQVRALPSSNSLVPFPQRAHATTESVAAILTPIGKPEHVRLDSRGVCARHGSSAFCASSSPRLLSHAPRV